MYSIVICSAVINTLQDYLKYRAIDLSREMPYINPWNAKIYLYKSWKPKGCVQFKIIINVLVSSFRFIWIPMLRVYGHYVFFFFLSVQGSTLDVRIWRLKSIPRAERVKLVWLTVHLSSPKMTEDYHVAEYYNVSRCKIWAIIYKYIKYINDSWSSQSRFAGVPLVTKVLTIVWFVWLRIGQFPGLSNVHL